MNKDANAMHDEFTLVYELRSDMGAQVTYHAAWPAANAPTPM